MQDESEARKSRPHRRQSRPERLKVLTRSQLAPSKPGKDAVQPSEEPEELIEFSFSEDGEAQQIKRTSSCSSQENVELETDSAGGMEQELLHENVMETDNVEGDDKPSNRPQGKSQRPQMPPRPERPQRPSLPPRHTQETSPTTSGDLPPQQQPSSGPVGEGSPQRPARPPRPQPSVKRDRAVSQPVPLSQVRLALSQTSCFVSSLVNLTDNQSHCRRL